MKYIIGIDGGGTKTETIAYDLDGKEIAAIAPIVAALASDGDKLSREILIE